MCGEKAFKSLQINLSFTQFWKYSDTTDFKYRLKIKIKEIGLSCGASKKNPKKSPRARITPNNQVAPPVLIN